MFRLSVGFSVFAPNHKAPFSATRAEMSKTQKIKCFCFPYSISLHHVVQTGQTQLTAFSLALKVNANLSSRLTMRLGNVMRRTILKTHCNVINVSH
jgi:hypothetical protein